MTKYVAPRGTQDVFGEKMRIWREIERIARKNCDLYHVSEIKTPIFEHTEVFKRGNDGSDVVNKEMYTFEDKGGRSLTLKPEGTAGVIRAYVENKLYATGGNLQRYFYIAPNFRYERPQKGRMRMHYQFGVEYIGDSSPLVDVEAISLGLKVLNEIGITQYKLVINTLGDQSSQDAYRSVLVKHFSPVIDELGEDNQRRLLQNPLRILDDKGHRDHPAIKDAPTNRDTLSDESLAYFDEVCSLLDAQGIPYEIDPRLVRGLDYYNHTVFEVISMDEGAGAQSTIFAGGRYDGLVSYFGGPKTSAFGFGMGIERLLVFIESSNVSIGRQDVIDVFGMPLDAKSQSLVFKAMQDLRNHGYCVDMDYSKRSMRAQFKLVDRYQAKVALLVGESEVENQMVTLKNIETQEQVVVPYEGFVLKIKEWLGERI